VAIAEDGISLRLTAALVAAAVKNIHIPYWKSVRFGGGNHVNRKKNAVGIAEP
jgi:hypothetical protein